MEALKLCHVQLHATLTEPLTMQVQSGKAQELEPPLDPSLTDQAHADFFPSVGSSPELS